VAPLAHQLTRLIGPLHEVSLQVEHASLDTNGPGSGRIAPLDA
jgi:hypothetical protein